ncbi:hypothetical protein [Cohnella herbarum]|uniref:Exosporium protein C n=1 Tax=Cohnella herbarum TaxID=2728023 RepID=A0A7Z2VP17_9BACL|nr:hypothetical protein [Cohnella herbarum]QJD86507.1 hypothetical protein HH215_27300 [Cohnella herbarum]
MSIQFLDERLSIHRSDSSGTEILTATPLFIGDIGLQVLAAIPAGNAANVRVALNGIVGIQTDIGVFATINLTVERNSTGVAGTGVTILTESYSTEGVASFPPISVSAGDFPPASAVLAGQIRYTLFISVTDTESSLGLKGPVVFNGSASAGVTT